MRCYKGDTGGLQGYHRGLAEFYRGVTGWNRGVIGVLLVFHEGVSWSLCGCCRDITGLLRECYNSVKGELQLC